MISFTKPLCLDRTAGTGRIVPSPSLKLSDALEPLNDANREIGAPGSDALVRKL